MKTIILKNTKIIIQKILYNYRGTPNLIYMGYITLKTISFPF